MPKAPKVPVTELPIHTYMCVNDPSRPALAMIGKLPMTFTAATPMKAWKAANDWRKAEVAKIEAQREAIEKRKEAAARAREAKKQPTEEA